MRTNMGKKGGILDQGEWEVLLVCAFTQTSFGDYGDPVITPQRESTTPGRPVHTHSGKTWSDGFEENRPCVLASGHTLEGQFP